MLRIVPVAALLIAGLVFAAGALAGEAPAPGDKTTPAFTCSAQTEGQLTCQANKQCTCAHRPADAASGLPARWAWDCGVMRPRCEVTPADTGEGGHALPPVIIERRDKKGEEK